MRPPSITWDCLSAARQARKSPQLPSEFTPAAAEVGYYPFAIGNALKENGQRAEAIAIWQEILRLAPGNPFAIQALDQAERQNWQTAASTAQDSVPISIATRGAVDRAIVRDIWERDTYGIGHVSSPPQTVVDIGAHIGAFSVRAHRAWPNARIIACEPDSDNFSS